VTFSENATKSSAATFQLGAEIPDNAKLGRLPDDYDKENDVVRVVKIGDLDANTYVSLYTKILFLSQLTNLNPLVAAVLTLPRLRTFL
jgi:hypothetical protein